MRTKIKTPESSCRLLALLLLCLLAAGCRHRRTRVSAPPPPQIERQGAVAAVPHAQEHLQGGIITSEVGVASWYGSPYHGARSANGHVYDEDAMTAAHRTLPLGSLVRVTNLSTHQSAVVTITDRGPFVPGRILDLSRAAAIRVGVWRPGTAWVRMDVLQVPANARGPGKWCVQIGVFRREHTAKDLRDRLRRRYSDARVIEFKGPTGYWVRIRRHGETHQDALAAAKTMRFNEGDAYVVRLN